MDGAEFAGTCVLQVRRTGTGVGGQCMLRSLLSEKQRRVGWKHTHTHTQFSTCGRSDVLKYKPDYITSFWAQKPSMASHLP